MWQHVMFIDLLQFLHSIYSKDRFDDVKGLRVLQKNHVLYCMTINPQQC